ncbi:hypothetical protein LSM04_006995 [Trypanosoma melophagium]|uniref:uncharacterized protein n=1 Tax=Trypanosoma melophagium TaxID=715481 RepID=UPI00351A4893|nr:hypothetical protein LSM04_006995 [Trypanosoma melophagium]
MKRSREDVPSSVVQDQRTKGEKGQTLIEEIATVEEKHSILVRFPCLDFFRDAHLCEVTVDSKETEGGNGNNDTNNKNSEGEENTNDNGNKKENETRYFSPDAVTFKEGTLETDHPIVLVHTQHYGTMEFEGTWCDVHGPQVSPAPLSNRIVVHLCKKSSEQAVIARGSISGESNSNESHHTVDVNSVEAGVEVASLLKHPSVGVTADEARRWEVARNASWAYSRIDVPCATLVLRRVK